MDAFDIVDWRRRVFALYADVRATNDAAGAHELWCRTRDDLFGNHAASPLMPADRSGFGGLPVAPYDPDWRFEVKVAEAAPARVDLATGTDGVVPFERLGVADVPGIGSLDVWRFASYGGGLFVPVKDASAGKPGGTYGGGRYLLDTVKGADLGFRDGALMLDFNFAYNPSCAYDPAWACPLAQPGNTVAADIPVGERSPADHDR
ncbi:MAG: DUF1684 domain-containing protein [Nocardioidaceae bacterium]